MHAVVKDCLFIYKKNCHVIGAKASISHQSWFCDSQGDHINLRCFYSVQLSSSVLNVMEFALIWYNLTIPDEVLLLVSASY